VNNAKAGRNKNEFFATIDAGNQESAVSKQVSVVGVVYDPNEVPEIGGGQLGNAVGSDVVSTVTGNVLLPKASENPVYDAGGRLVSTSLWNYTWDSEDRLLAIESSSGNLPESSRVKVEFAYDYSGRRIQKLVYKFSSADNWQLTTDHRYFYDPVLLNGQPADFGLLTAENIVNHETNETIELQYLWGLDLNGAYQGLGGNGGLLAVIDKTHSKVYLPCSDAKGTIHSYVDADTGTVVAKFAYDPYGRIISQTFAPGSSPLPFSLGFQSKYYDSEFQCYYFGFRYFDPATCRWLNRDPLGESGGYNLYAYCNGDPINGMDYLGCVWYNPLDSDFCLYTAGYNTALHIYETGYSPVRAGMRMYDTGASWNLINPLKGSFFAYETLDGGLDALRVAGGLPISIGSGDIFDRQDVANFDPLHPTIIDNGMLNSDQNAKDMQMAVQEKLGITSSGLVKNTSHFLGIGDAVQIFGNEFGLIDITAIRTAQMIRKADSLGTQYIDTINHSQGAETFQTALGLVDSPSILRKIRNQSFGGESYNDAKGLNALSMNKDWVPTFAMGNPLNAIQTIRKFTGSEWIDTVSREGNNHGFITFYSDLITNYNK
jgi:RHS repeat-associated protein